MAYSDESYGFKRHRSDSDADMHKTGYMSYGDGAPPRKRKDMEPEKPNHIILITIMNPAYPITVDVLHTICSPNGQVLRLVIFKKNGVQAMVEFDSVESAARAKESLQGADIYSGCCTLRIEFAKPSRLNVYKNDTESWDYTNTTPEKPDMYNKSPLLQEPRYGSAPTPYGRSEGMRSLTSQLYGSHGQDRYENGMGMSGQSGRASHMMYGGGGGMSRSHDLGVDRYSAANGYSANGGGFRPSPPRPGLAGNGPLAAQGGLSSQGGPLPQQGSVVMVYGLNKDAVNADRLFNLFCLYGNVVRVKFLKTKEGCAMVQLGDALAVERAVGHLNNLTFFGSKMQLGYSKQAFLNDVQQPYDLSDGTASFKDYMGCKNNRFVNPEMAMKNRIQAPSKVIHFFNTPPHMTDDDLKAVFTDSDVSAPIMVKFFPSKTERSSSGVMEFEDLSQATEALVVCNHSPITNQNSKFPFLMKLCFSSTRLTERGERGERSQHQE